MFLVFFAMECKWTMANNSRSLHCNPNKNQIVHNSVIAIKYLIEKYSDIKISWKYPLFFVYVCQGVVLVRRHYCVRLN